MEQYIKKSALVAEIEKRISRNKKRKEWEDIPEKRHQLIIEGQLLGELKHFLDSLEVKEEDFIVIPYDVCIQYTDRESAIKAHAEDYSWNIESELFQQLTPEQQKLWRKEIEQACISGGYCGLNLQKDSRYDDNLGVKEVDLNEEIEKCLKRYSMLAVGKKDFTDIAKHFFELGMRVNNPITAEDRGTAEEIIINLKRVENDYHIDLTKQMEWLRNIVKKGE